LTIHQGHHSHAAEDPLPPDRIADLLSHGLRREGGQAVEIDLGLMGEVIANRLDRAALSGVDGGAACTELSNPQQARKGQAGGGFIGLEGRIGDQTHRRRSKSKCHLQKNRSAR